MFGMGFGELMLVLIIVVIMFGSAKLPTLGERVRVLQSRRPHEPPRPTDWVFIGILAVLLSFALAVAAVTSAGSR